MTSTARLLFHRPRVIHADDRKLGLMMILCAALTIAWLDALDNEAYWRNEANRANSEVSRRNALESLPNPAIVLDAATAEKYGVRLAEIAGGLDGERAKLRGAK